MTGFMGAMLICTGVATQLRAKLGQSKLSISSGCKLAACGKWLGAVGFGETTVAQFPLLGRGLSFQCSPTETALILAATGLLRYSEIAS